MRAILFWLNDDQWRRIEPFSFSKKAYRQRHLIENAFCRLERRAGLVVVQGIGQRAEPHVTPQPRAVVDVDRVFHELDQHEADIVDVGEDPFRRRVRIAFGPEVVDMLDEGSAELKVHLLGVGLESVCQRRR